MAALKTKPTIFSVASFIAAVPNETRRADAKALVKLMAEISGEKPTMWGPTVIGFGSHKYKYASGHGGEMCRIGFAPRAGSLVLYINMRNDPNDPLRTKLGKHKIGVGCLYINKLADVDMGVLRQMIERAWNKKTK